MPAAAADALPTDDGFQIQVLLADDHEILRDALESRLRSGSIAVVGAAADGEECVELYSQLNPDVVLCDLSLPKIDGIEVARRIRKDDPEARIVMFSAFEDSPSIEAALTAGALGYLSKQTPLRELVLAIADAAEGKPVFDRVTAAAAVNSTRKDPDALSPREIEVLQEMANGLTNPEIAEKLFISKLTVKTHCARLYTKMGVNDRAAAVAVGMRRKLIT